MNIRAQGDNIFGETPTPCFLVELERDEIVYMNPAMQEMLEMLGSPDDIFGKKFYNVITNRGSSCSLCVSSEELTTVKKIEHHLYNVMLGRHFRVTHVLVNLFGNDYNLSKYYELDTNDSTKVTFEEAMTRCISIFQKPKHAITADFMELLCEFYDCDRAYVYYINYDTMEITCDTQWSTDPYYKVPQNLGAYMNANVLIEWFRTRNEFGIVEANRHNVRFTKDVLSENILSAFQLDNLTMSVIEDLEGKILGVVGLSNRREQAFNYRLIDAVTRFITQDMNNKTALEVTLALVNSKDALTGFHSRDMYSKFIEQMKVSSPQSLGIVFVNVNGLKQINVEGGFVKGDSHIQKSAITVRDHFGFDFYRISGDEFVGVAPDISKEEFETLVEKHHTIMKDSGNYAFALGHAWASGTVNFLRLVHEADTVMYINKQEYYHNAKPHYEEVESSILGNLLRYLQDGEFLVYLQPQVSLETGCVLGAEALVRRYDKANQRMIYPDQFIPLYEKRSIVRHIDLFVLNKVCEFLVQWQKSHTLIPISVNLSRVTLLEHGIVDTITTICDSHGLDHRYLVLEVTERVGLIESDVASTLIDQLHNRGFRVSLDDFGCAYSNIVTLANVSVNEVKLDKSIIDNLKSNVKNRIIAKNILSMCNELEDTETLAEGIEDETQAQILKEFGCTMGQGYLYARPMPYQDFFEQYIAKKTM